jgi:hypothetical protein
MVGCVVAADRPSSDSARKPFRDLLQHVAVALGVVERGVRAAFGIGPGGALLVADVEAADEAATGFVERLTHLDAAREEFVAGGLDVVHRQEQPVERARLGGGDAVAEDDRAVRSGGVSCINR